MIHQQSPMPKQALLGASPRGRLNRGIPQVLVTMPVQPTSLSAAIAVNRGGTAGIPDLTRCQKPDADDQALQRLTRFNSRLSTAKIDLDEPADIAVMPASDDRVGGSVTPPTPHGWCSFIGGIKGRPPLPEVCIRTIAGERRAIRRSLYGLRIKIGASDPLRANPLREE
jgi:hypothetical protein